MTRKEAYKLKRGDLVMDPFGAVSHVVSITSGGRHSSPIINTLDFSFGCADVNVMPSLRLRWEAEDNDRRRCQASKAR
jgi:hypothetical protein